MVDSGHAPIHHQKNKKPRYPNKDEVLE